MKQIISRYSFVTSRARRLIWATALLGLPLTNLAAEAATQRRFKSFADLPPTAARMLAPGTRLVMSGVALGEANRSMPVELELERVSVFAPDVEIVLHAPSGDTYLPIPDIAYFIGKVAGRPTSRVSLGMARDGKLEGIVADRGSYWTFADQPADATVEAMLVDTERLARQQGGFRCDVDRMSTADLLNPPDALPETEIEAVISQLNATEGVLYTARVAIETDQEFLAKFANPAAATTYVGNLFAFASAIYSDEIDTNMVVSHLSLWAAPDPWAQTTTACGLLEFGKYWNDNRATVSRTIAHFLSGKNNGGGIAWLGVLCSGSFSLTPAQVGCGTLSGNSNWGGGYGYSGQLAGNFNPTTQTLVWDAMVTNHEIGHNFNSPHTHCYGGIGGNANPVDACYSGECGGTGCSCTAATLPGPANSGAGTLMSYCHLLGGGLNNISPTFGEGHPRGVVPQRVPDRMTAHVVSRAQANPSCLALTAPTANIFGDGFESGNRNNWD